MPSTHGTWTGSTPITLVATGLPIGVTFTDNSDGTYTLNGTYPFTPGSYPYTVIGTNAAGSTSQTGNLIISTATAAPVILSGLPIDQVVDELTSFSSNAIIANGPILTVTLVPTNARDINVWLEAIFVPGSNEVTFSGISPFVTLGLLVYTFNIVITNAGGSVTVTNNVISVDNV